MASWSTESATKAYIQTLETGRRGKEPGVAEFIAALAAGNNAQLMVVVCAACAGSTVLALGAAARETGGRAVCILPGLKELNASRKVVGSTYADSVEFVVGEARCMLLEEYQDADFVLVDCKMDEHRLIIEAGRQCLRRRNACLVGYNALHCVVPPKNDLKAHFLPIGEGLLMVTAGVSSEERSRTRGAEKQSRWVVKVDEFTGEEHVYRITMKQMNKTHHH